MTSSSSSLFVGIDVAKDKLDLATSEADRRVQTFDNDPAGHRRIVELLLASKPARIVVESTGGYEWPLIHALLEADLVRRPRQPDLRPPPGDRAEDPGQDRPDRRPRPRALRRAGRAVAAGTVHEEPGRTRGAGHAAGVSSARR